MRKRAEASNLQVLSKSTSTTTGTNNPNKISKARVASAANGLHRPIGAAVSASQDPEGGEQPSAILAIKDSENLQPSITLSPKQPAVRYETNTATYGPK